MATQNVVIVGGGGAGLPLFKQLALPSSVRLTLVTPKPYYTHLLATARMIVTAVGKVEDQALIPFPESYNKGNRRVVIGKVASVVDDKTSRYVVLESGEHVDYDVLVIATGSIWQEPLSFPDSKEGTLEKLKTWRNNFKKAKDIVLVGGGAVGFELAGEIKDEYPNKNVSIVHANRMILNDAYPDHWREKLTKQLTGRGVKFVLNDRLERLEPVDGKVETRNGIIIPADLVLTTWGPVPNTKFLESLGDDVLTSTGNVKVKPTLQLEAHPRIFAVGDIIDWEEQKQWAKALNHSSAVAASIPVALKEGPEAAGLTPYPGGPEMISITNGKNSGSTFLNIMGGITLWDWVSTLTKSRGLLIGMAKSKMGL